MIVIVFYTYHIPLKRLCPLMYYSSPGSSNRRNKLFRRRERQRVTKTLGALDISGNNPTDEPTVGSRPQQQAASGKRPRSEGSSPLVVKKTE